MSGTWSALIKVCVHCMDEEKIQPSFLEKFIPLVNTTSETGSSPLHFVALGENIRLATWLLEKGATIVANEDEQTPLHWACKNGYLPMVELFLDNMTKEQILKKDFEGLSASDWAKYYEHAEIGLAIEQITKKKPKTLKQEKDEQKKLRRHRRISAIAFNIFQSVKL